jgi:hypothetical protein
VALEVCSIDGRRIIPLMDRWCNADAYSMPFNGKGLPSGVYLCRITCNGFKQAKRMMLVR